MPVNQQLTEEPQIGIEPMTASLLVVASSRFPSVATSEAGVVEAPKNVRFRQNARRSGEQVVSRNGAGSASRAMPTEGQPLLDRIRAGVAFSPTGCWMWQGAKNSRGYGQIGLRINGKTVSKSVHRLVAGIAYGEIPVGMMALHHCDVRACCNPEHLYVGSVMDNARDCTERGRRANILAVRNGSKTHCPQGHPYSADNTYRDSDGYRHCRTCRAVSARRQSARRSAELAASKVAERAA